MRSAPLRDADPGMDEAIEELRSLIQQQWPSASFAVTRGEDPDGVYLEATVDVEDTDEVMDKVVDRLLEIQVDEGLSLYFIPLRPLERVLAQLSAPAAAGRG